jgi:hypothetical protein
VYIDLSFSAKISDKEKYQFELSFKVLHLLYPLLVVLQLDPDRFQLFFGEVGALGQPPQTCGPEKHKIIANSLSIPGINSSESQPILNF